MPTDVETLTDEGGADRSTAAALLVFAVGYNVAHHNGLIGATSAGGGTRVADWVDLLTPVVVVLPLLWFLWLQRAGGRSWLVAAVGSIVYVEGHGIHLSANSISNVAPAATTSEQALDVIHLWDEVVGHYVWFGGLAILLAVCAASVSGRQLNIPGPILAIGGAISGVTWATNGLEGGTAVASLGCAVVAVGWAARRRRGLGLALLAGGVVAVVILGGYGLVRGGFPQPSSL